MGCGGSKEIPNLNNNNVKVGVTSSVGDQENDGQKGDDNLMESNSIDSPSPLPLTPVKYDNEKTTQFADDKNFENARESLNDGVFDGWSQVQPKQNQKRNVPGQKIITAVESEQDSEYGKDGIDLTSTSVALTSPKKSEVLDDGIQFEVTHRLNKKHSEEPFDPSSLVDMDKFKAVNVPRQAKKTHDKDNTVSMDTKQERKRSISNGQVPHASPTNYNEYYDEDEKALMESIEQDFVGTLQTTLPGTVM